MTFEREKISLNLARIKKEGKHFEVAVDPDLAIKYKENPEGMDIRDVLKSEEVFYDAKKGELASEHELKQVFGTDDPLKVAEEIIRNGEIQLTAEYRAEMREKKRKQIIQIIHRNGVDPRTHLPHPAARIENAMEEAKVRIDEHKRAEDQVQDVLKKLRAVLPIKFEMKEIALHIPASYAGKTYGLVSSFGKLLKEEWQNDGSWVGVVEIPGGLEGEFFDKLNAITHGEMESKIVKTK
ncbi:ribosome assembly factor SBDS [Candidatus Woesearchaeota archaeon]|nr:MAG: ribosome assembly factor SBDS [Candidatus Woesearchaeota archaeon]